MDRLPFSMDPTTAVAFLVSINVGVAFGNSIPAILVGVPGTPSAVLTAIDAFALHKQGKSRLALGVTYLASVFGQFFSILSLWRWSSRWPILPAYF